MIDPPCVGVCQRPVDSLLQVELDALNQPLETEVDQFATRFVDLDV